METKEENGRFIFEPDQFLTPTQIRRFFSRADRYSEKQANKSQSQVISVNQNDNEGAIAEQENEFDLAMSDFNEDILRSQALQAFRKLKQ